MKLSEINRLTIEAYNKTAEKYHTHFRNEMREKEYDRLILDKFSSLLNNQGMVCDAGCGPSGQVGEYLLSKKHEIVGIDISPKCIEIAKNYIPEIEFRVIDMMKTDFEDNKFDGLVCFYSIIYTPKSEVKKIIKEFNRILKKEGKLLIVVKKGIEEGIIDADWYEDNPVYFTKFMEGELETSLKENGFEIDYLDTRKPYDFEFEVDRIYMIGSKKKAV